MSQYPCISPAIDPHEIFRTSGAVEIAPAGAGHYAAWNRYYPEIVFLNRDGVTFLEKMKSNTHPYKSFTGIKRLFRKMARAGLFYGGAGDGSREMYMAGGRKRLDILSEQMVRHREERSPYLSLGVFTHRCNMSCPYCVVEYVRANHRSARVRTREEKTSGLIRVLDSILQVFSRKQTSTFRIMLNGGEILLEWDTVMAALDHVEKNYPHVHLELDMNTNGTLVTEEIARYISARNFKSVGISIDGYRETHNQTRRYHHGGGSYDDVMRGLGILNRNLKKRIRTYQGTLTVDHQVDIEKLMDMRRHNFRRARLGVNLLGISPEEAKRMAELHYRIALRAREEGWSVMDDHFKIFRTILSVKKRHAPFSFFCRGLNDLAGKSIYYNLDTGKANLLCHYVTDCHISLEEADWDIYHPGLFEKAEVYLRERFRLFESHCGECEAAGVCRGGCIIFGLDAFNRVNEAACVFMRETWRRYLLQGFTETVAGGESPLIKH